MFKHILVPIDLSDRNARTLAVAAALAEPVRARVTLLHIVYRVRHLAAGELAGFYRRLEAISRRRLERAARPLVARGLRVRTEVVVGEPAIAIVAAAARRRASLVVMGSHRVVPGRPGRGGGTTSYKVGILCRCPVLLVK
jgi:nucleotide-binding universal stress UspA family protein